MRSRFRVGILHLLQQSIYGFAAAELSDRLAAPSPRTNAPRRFFCRRRRLPMEIFAAGTRDESLHEKLPFLECRLLHLRREWQEGSSRKKSAWDWNLATIWFEKNKTTTKIFQLLFIEQQLQEFSAAPKYVKILYEAFVAEWKLFLQDSIFKKLALVVNSSYT